MIKKVLALTLAGLLVSLTTHVSTSAKSQTDEAAQQVGKIKTRITKLGTGKRARVEVKLRDNTRLKGYVGGISEEGFTVVDPKHGSVTSVRYDHVQQVRGVGHGRRDLALVLAGVAGVIVLTLGLVSASP